MPRYSIATLRNGVRTDQMTIKGFDPADVRNMAQRYTGELLSLGSLDLDSNTVAVEVIDPLGRVVFRIDVTIKVIDHNVVGKARELAERLRRPFQRSGGNDPEPPREE